MGDWNIAMNLMFFRIGNNFFFALSARRGHFFEFTQKPLNWQGVMKNGSKSAPQKALNVVMFTR